MGYLFKLVNPEFHTGELVKAHMAGQTQRESDSAGRTPTPDSLGALDSAPYYNEMSLL